MNNDVQNKPIRRTLDQFVKDIYQLTQQSASLLVFFTSNINKAGRIVIHNGNIVNVIYAHKQGNNALMAMLGILEVKYRTAPLTSDFKADPNLPENGIIFRALGAAILDEIVNENLLTHEQKLSLESLLISVIGPMGSIIAEERIHGAMTMSEALNGLEVELDNESLAEFKDKLN